MSNRLHTTRNPMHQFMRVFEQNMLLIARYDVEVITSSSNKVPERESG